MLSKQFTEVTSFLKQLEKAGIDPSTDLVQPVITDPLLCERLAQYCHAGMPALPPELLAATPCLPGDFEESDSQKRWRGLFREDFFGIPEVTRAGYRFKSDMLQRRKEVRIRRDGVLLSPDDSLRAAERCLEECPGKFVCIACLPKSVCTVHDRDAALFVPDLRAKSAWFRERDQREAWSREKIRDMYILLRKEPVPESHSMHAERQGTWLGETHPCERFARPEHLVYGYTVCFKATEGRLRLYNGDVWGRTLVRAAHGYLVYVRSYARGFLVSYWCDDARPHAGIPSLWTSF